MPSDRILGGLRATTTATATATAKRKAKKAIDLIARKTTTLQVYHAFLYISLPSLYDHNVKVPNFTFCGGRERRQQRLSFSFPELWYSLFEFKSRKNCQNLIKVEVARIHFLSDVFVAVAVVGA